jgi:hypothetical protein
MYVTLCVNTSYTNMWHVLENTLSKMFEIVIIKLNSFEKTFWWSCKYKSRSKKFTCLFGIVPMNSLVRRTNYLPRASGKWVMSKTGITNQLKPEGGNSGVTAKTEWSDLDIVSDTSWRKYQSDKRNFIGTSPNRQVNFLLLYLYLHDHQNVFFQKNSIL